MQPQLKLALTSQDVCHNLSPRVGTRNNSSCSLPRVGAQQSELENHEIVYVGRASIKQRSGHIKVNI